ncbi:MAG: DMT family transporter, partial [Alphaproteobacteria bacterium]
MTATRLLPATFVVLWATGVIGAKAGVPYAEPFTFLALRFGLVIVVLTVVALIFRAPWPRRRPALDAMVAGGLIHGLYLGGVFWAIDRGMPAGVSALILGLQPILTAVLAGLMLGERTRPRHWAGLGLGLAGLLLVLWPRFGDGAGGITLATVSATLGAVAAITLGSIHQKRFGARMDLRTGSVFQYLGALLVVGGAAWLGESMAVDWTPAFMLSLGWLVLALSIGA